MILTLHKSIPFAILEKKKKKKLMLIGWGKKKIHSSGALDDDSVEHCVISSYIQLAVASFSNHSRFF